MQKISHSIIKDLVLVGGGHSHAIVLKLFGMKPLPGVRLTLISDVTHTPYSGMLPGHIAGFYDYDRCHIDLRSLAQFAQAQFFRDRVTALDLNKNQVICTNHPPIAFDLLSINIGSTPNTLSVVGAAEWAIPVKPVPQFLNHWNQLLEARQTSSQNSLQIAIVGGGIGGVELALNMQTGLLKKDAEFSENLSNSINFLPIQPANKSTFEIHLFHSAKQLAQTHNFWVSRRLQEILIERGIQLHLNETVSAVEKKDSAQFMSPYYIRCQSGLTVECDRIYWVTQASAPNWLEQAGLATDEKGFIQVNDSLQSISHPHIFAAGDIAMMINHPRPKAGVFAVRQGKPLFENLQRFLQEKPLKPFVPQKQYLALIGTGNRSAIASRGPFIWESPLLWQWKDWIDRKFMEKFSNLSIAMPSRDTEAHKNIPLPRTNESLPAMYCAGCGSKVGNQTLERALNRLKQEFRIWQQEEILIGLNSPDDCAVVQVPSGQLMLHTLDYFPALVNDPFIFGKIVTNHSLSDIFAMGATPQTALALAAIPYGTEAKVEETLYQLLAGAIQILNHSQTALVGGHTIEAAELAFGLSCNGLATPDRLLQKGGMKPDQVLILTKPLGTGTLFAAERRLQAKGRWIDSAIESMLLSNQMAAHCFLQHQASACTDITGFGLMGHLREMIQGSLLAINPSKVILENLEFNHLSNSFYQLKTSLISVELFLEAIPILEGALRTINLGITSSIQSKNLQASESIDNLTEVRNHPYFPLLFDPQTAGGLLAAVPEKQAESCLASLKAYGYKHSSRIGRVKLLEVGVKPVTVLC